jgi:hypothetical protein
MNIAATIAKSKAIERRDISSSARLRGELSGSDHRFGPVLVIAFAATRT